MNALYADGVQDMALDLRVLKHSGNYLVAELVYDSDDSLERVGIISHIDFEWLRQFCPDLWTTHPPEALGMPEEGSVSLYLCSLFPPG